MNSGNRRRLRLNTTSSLIFQITTLVCGFIVPRLILQTYGSAVNGLVNSISQFLQVISFLELGVGAVVQSSLYKPLADKDYEQSSKIVASAGKFFKRIAQILLVYVIFLMIFYPTIVNTEFDWVYTATLILVISISSFAQYYFGMVDRLFLTADQHGYIQYTAQTVTLIINTLACLALINMGAGIHIVKLATSLIYVVRPLVLRWYVNRHYNLDRKIHYEGEPIKQKWNGLAQHVAAIVLDGTDNIVLTTFSTLSNVSVYSVYHLVVYGLSNLVYSATNGMTPLLGELWAKQETKQLKETFNWFEWVMHTGAVFVYGCAGMLIIPFVRVYTNGITDADYVQPLFAVVLTMAYAVRCIRYPYNSTILAAGHYKQTQSNYIIAAVMNIVLSILMVVSFGLVGVAIGTLAAMLFQTVWMAVYNSKHLVKGTLKSFFKHAGVDIFTVLVGIALTMRLSLADTTYMAWFIMAVKCALIWAADVIVVNTVFYHEMVLKIFNLVKGMIAGMISKFKRGGGTRRSK